MTIALEMGGVTRRFGARTALDGVALRIPSGRAVCLMGPNGAGKTTLLAIAAGVLQPDSGSVTVFGQRPGPGGALARLVGYMADVPLLYGALSARENLTFYARLFGLPRPRRRIGELLDLVGLSNRADDAVADYSAGMARRLDLARAVLHEPRLLLMDEPVNSLDTEGLDLLTTVLAMYRTDDRASLFAGHTAQMAACRADQTLIIERGRVVDGTTAAPSDSREDKS